MMNFYQKSFFLIHAIIWINLGGISYAQSFGEVENVPEIKLLNEKYQEAHREFETCQIDISTNPLPKEDVYSAYSPQEVIFKYNNQEILKLKQSSNSEELSQFLKFTCMKVDNYVYLFLDTLHYSSCQKLNLCDPAYVVFSSDAGRQWSSLKSLTFMTGDDFVLPTERLFNDVKILKGENKHFFRIYNLRGDNVFLFDANLSLLKTIKSVGLGVDVSLYNDNLFIIHDDCNNNNCPGYSLMEMSSDGGQSWEKREMPYMTSAKFFVHNNNLYFLSVGPCPSSIKNMLSIIPALGPVCGNLQIQKLENDGQWGSPKVLSKTVSDLLEVYNDQSPILVWRDIRFHKSRGCGFIPLIGCVDSEAIEIQKAFFTGQLNMETMSLDNEALIK